MIHLVPSVVPNQDQPIDLNVIRRRKSLIDNNLGSSRGEIRTLDLTIMNRRNAPGRAVLPSKIAPSVYSRNPLKFVSHSAKHSAKNRGPVSSSTWANVSGGRAS